MIRFSRNETWFNLDSHNHTCTLKCVSCGGYMSLILYSLVKPSLFNYIYNLCKVNPNNI